LIVKFWNVYGIEKDMEKAHVITDFIKKGFETGIIDMMTDGSEHREFLYAEDCCEALETVMQEYSVFTSDDDLHITSGSSTSILDIARTIQSLFKENDREVSIVPAESKDDVQKDARNEANPHIKQWWRPQTNISDGIAKVFEEMKKDYENI
jgi:nucleoside-diphosphate-sugar epimerase